MIRGFFLRLLACQGSELYRILLQLRRIIQYIQADTQRKTARQRRRVIEVDTKIWFETKTRRQHLDWGKAKETQIEKENWNQSQHNGPTDQPTDRPTYQPTDWSTDPFAKSIHGDKKASGLRPSVRTSVHPFSILGHGSLSEMLLSKWMKPCHCCARLCFVF